MKNYSRKKVNRKKPPWELTARGDYEETAVADLLSTGSFIYLVLVKKTPDSWKKLQTSNTQVHYTFDVAKTEEILDFLLKEKFITFP